MTREELAAHPSYPELLAADGHNLLGRLAALEHTSAGQQGAIDALTDLLKSTLQRVNDLTAQLKSHAAAPYAHVRYTIRDLGVIVADGLDAALADYDPRDQMDTPITDEQQTAECEALARGPILDAGLTDAACERIWASVQTSQKLAAA